MAHHFEPLVQSQICQLVPFASRAPEMYKISFSYYNYKWFHQPEVNTLWQSPGTWLHSRHEFLHQQNIYQWRNGLLAVIRYQLLP